ncbi:ribonuclease HI family protein [Candidatus Pacearchaeota archaeon]|nr:ribonuclease HI family protein [Candidatus Pacearchaeota archaeon]
MIYTNSDGGSRGNPGPGAIGVLVRKNDNILETYGEKIGKVTNNVAEYKALIKALELAKKHTDDEITCILDSELVVRQLLGDYQVKNKNEELKKLFLQVQKLQENFRKIKYVHVRRYDVFQQIVDSILNMELDGKN